MPFVSITRLRIRTPEFVDAVRRRGARRLRPGRRRPGQPRHRTCCAEANATFWTRTVWTDRAAMRSYMTSGDHGDVMPLLRDWCDEAHVAHWEQEDSELPTWEEAHRRIVEEGRVSAVAHPSPVHATRAIAAPVVGLTATA